jgi:hypothetical protein
VLEWTRGAATSALSTFTLMNFATSTNSVLTMKGDGGATWRSFAAGTDIRLERAHILFRDQQKVVNGDIIRCGACVRVRVRRRIDSRVRGVSRRMRRRTC